MAPAPELDLETLREQWGLARLKISGIDQQLDRLRRERDEFVAQVARLERSIDEQEGKLARPERARAEIERAREHLRRDQ